MVEFRKPINQVKHNNCMSYSPDFGILQRNLRILQPLHTAQKINLLLFELFSEYYKFVFNSFYRLSLADIYSSQVEQAYCSYEEVCLLRRVAGSDYRFFMLGFSKNALDILY